MRSSLHLSRKHVIRLLCVCEDKALKPGLLIVVPTAEYVCDDAPKLILKLSTHRLQVFLL